MYKIVPKNDNTPKTLQVCLKHELRVLLTRSAASFFGNRGEREALAQLAIKMKTKNSCGF